MADIIDPIYANELPAEWRSCPGMPVSIHADEQGHLSICWHEIINGEEARLCHDIRPYLAADLISMLSQALARRIKWPARIEVDYVEENREAQADSGG